MKIIYLIGGLRCIDLSLPLMTIGQQGLVLKLSRRGIRFLLQYAVQGHSIRHLQAFSLIGPSDFTVPLGKARPSPDL